MKVTTCKDCIHRPVCKYYTKIREATNLLFTSLANDNNQQILFKHFGQVEYQLFKNKVEDQISELTAPCCDNYKKE